MKRDIVLGFVILLVIAGIIYFSRRSNNEPPPVPTPTASTESDLEDKFNRDLPDDAEKVELKDVSGGDGIAIASRKFADGKFNVSVLADLAEPTAGQRYQVWLVRGKEGDSNFGQISLGGMTLAKGGYLLEYQGATNYSDYRSVVISLEKIIDSKLEKKVLEGTF